MTWLRTWGSWLGAAVLCAACGGSSSNSGDDQAAPDAGSPDAAGPAYPIAVPLTSVYAEEYLASTQFGTQTFTTLLDTGSSTTAVASATCATCAGLSPLYAPGTSATDAHRTDSSDYADGSGWHGEIYTDGMSMLQGSPSVPVRFASIQTQSDFFDEDEQGHITNLYQGIVGLGPTELLDPGTTSYFDQLTTGSSVPDVMSFELCDDSGTMWLGGYDPAAAAAAPQYTPMRPIDPDNNPWYAVAIDGMSLGGTAIGSGPSSFGDQVIDTGTSLFYIPQAAENALLAAINGAPSFSTMFTGTFVDDSEYNDSCLDANTGVTTAQIDATMPPLAMTFPAVGGGDFTISVPATRSYLYDEGDGSYCLTIYDDAGIGPTMGDTMMRAFLTVFDIGNNQVGLATAAGCDTAHRFAPAVRPPTHEYGHPRRRPGH